MAIHIDPDRVWQHLMRLSEFRDASSPGWTRRAFTPEYQAARQWLKDLMTSAGLEVTWDPGANLVGSHTGSVPTRFVVGSHSDTVIGAGRFDGMLGVIAAIECAHVLHENGWPFRHGLHVYDFLAEEPSPYGVSTVGSRAVSGHLPPNLLSLRNSRGETLAEGIRGAGGDPAVLSKPLLAGDDIAAYLELHIEQGPSLESHKLPLGIVTGIVGIRRYRVMIEGSPGHAGTTPMGARHDALVAASTIVTQVHQWAAKQVGNIAATVGQIEIQPNALNVIPGTSTLGIEVRALDADHLDRFTSFLGDIVSSLKTHHDYETSIFETTRENPALMDTAIRRTMGEVFRHQGWEHIELPSWAGHDAVQMTHVSSRCGMIFVPSRGGLSHCPEEWTEPRDVALGAQALLQSILRLDRDIN